MRKIISKEETAPGRFLRFCYHTKAGELFLRAATCRTVSKVAGAFLDSPLSRPIINGYVERNGIDMTQFEEGPFPSFNAFFTRRVKSELRPVDTDENAFISPCDAKLSLYRIDEQGSFDIKGFSYTVERLVKSGRLAEFYRGGYCVVLRLSVDDYHRYIYLDDCLPGKERFIKGKLHTVQPVALEARRVFTENCRACTILRTANFGKVTEVEVGALMVGRIVNNKVNGPVARGDEKGRFEFGGSTIVLLVEKDRVAFDEEFFVNTANDAETVVRCGERIGTKIKR